MTHQVTLKDVAAGAGVHVSTASRALNPETRDVVSEATVRRVLEVARTLGYRPHPLAQGLRTNRTMTVGIVVPDLTNPLFPPITLGVESVLWERGYSLLAGNTGNDTAHADRVVRSLADRRVDGVVLASATRSDPSANHLVSRGIPVVLVNRSSGDPSVPAIVVDDQAGVGMAVRHLADLGHRRVAHVAGPATTSTGLGRRRAFDHWRAKLGLDRSPDLVVEADTFQTEPGFRAALRLLTLDPHPTALIAANDLLALGCYRAAAEMGLEVPGDVSVIGYNDMPLVDLMHPPMTSVRVPTLEMGAEAGRALLTLITRTPDGATGDLSRRFAPEFAMRASTSAPRI